MPRSLRVLVPGMLYHIYSRGNDRRPVVLTGTDRAVLLATVGATVRRSGWKCVGYCVMENHYHLLVVTPEPNLPTGMQWLNGTYARRFNTAHERDGHLWQGRYGATPVVDDEYLMRLVAYLPMNPVKSGECESPVEYPWSSFRAIVGVEPPPSFLDIDWTLDLFAEDRGEARRLFELHVREWPLELRQLVTSLDADQIRRARSAGFTLREIAAELGVHATTVMRCNKGV
jgi:REP element-mobilizing transposase RayT